MKGELFWVWMKHLSFILVLSLTACVANVTPTPPPVVIKAAGSTSMEPLLAELTAAYTPQHPQVTFDIQGGGSQLGQTLVEAGQVELGLVSFHPPQLAETTRLVPIARDAIAIILHPQNPLPDLSLAELRDIFSGRLLNWQEVAGLAGPIQVVSREDGSGTRAVFEMMVMEDRPVTPTAVVLPNSQAVVDFVAQNPNAIAYASFIFLDDRVYPVPLEAVPPTLENVTSGSYLLTRDLFLIIPSQSQPEVADFFDFILSPAGQAVVTTKWGQAGQ
jgi:phosphate transport system substrate-binding protein